MITNAWAGNKKGIVLIKHPCIIFILGKLQPRRTEKSRRWRKIGLLWMKQLVGPTLKQCHTSQPTSNHLTPPLCYCWAFHINFIKQNYISPINLLLQTLSCMSAKKKMSNGSLPTQTQNSKRFVRRNSFHTLNCRSGSLKKLAFASQELFASSPLLESAQIMQSPKKNSKLEIETSNFFKEFEEPFQIPLKRSSGSMKVDHCRQKKCSSDRQDNLRKQLQIREEEAELLSAQCKKLKSQLHEEQEKRKGLEEEVRCNQQEIKRLEKRVEKYRNEKDKYEKERDLIVKHIQELESVKFDSEVKNIQGYRVKIMEEEVNKLRMDLEKSRSTREKQLIKEVDGLIQKKYAVQGELKSANIANIVLSKQLEEREQQMEQMRQTTHKAVISSYEYVQLRQRYRKMLIEYRELRAEISLLQRGNSSRSRVLESTLLTISQSEDMGYEV